MSTTNFHDSMNSKSFDGRQVMDSGDIIFHAFPNTITIHQYEQ